ncbi:MAG: DUF3558 domain-containing protein [Corynebacterium humireducens]|jgi:hypothetical protein|uniref:DUF3558 domain-containing protein n=1 Tax=Corynebacterium humireducens TaxID=1223514 RepID=A0A7X6PMC8_9CORY|nr:DUF3558 domain-containing protein [Corynebacterium humireducens]
MPVRRLLPVALGALLTACSPTTLDDAPPAPTPEPAPVLELGDFDPAGDFAVFDPCTEIPPEVLAGAGLGERVREPSYDGNMSVLCSFASGDVQVSGVFSLVGDRNTRTKIEERGLLLDGSPRTGLQGTYLHAMPGDIGNDCSAAVHTNRGRFVVKYGEILTERSRIELCGIAINTLEKITATLGENSGNLP